LVPSDHACAHTFFPVFIFQYFFPRTFSKIATFEIQCFKISVSCFSSTCRYNTVHVPCGFHIFSLFSSIFSISFHYSTHFSSIFSKWFHYSTYLSSICSKSFHYFLTYFPYHFTISSVLSISFHSKLKCKMIWKIWQKGKSNSEKIWIIWKKPKLNSENIWKIQKKSKLNSEMRWKIQKKSKLSSERHICPYHFTIQSNFLVYFSYLFAFQLTFLP
jgi:hypothetical protein